MTIKSIVVHPKGATHIQKFSDSTYFMKVGEVDGEPSWMFHGRNVGWISDGCPVESLPYKCEPLR